MTAPSEHGAQPAGHRTVASERGPQLDALARLSDPVTLQDPYPFYAWLREHAPVYRNPAGGIYLVSRNASARAVYQSPDVRNVGPEDVAAVRPAWADSRLMRLMSQGLATADVTRHARLRRAISPHFTLRQAKHLEAAAGRHCDALLARLAARLKDGETADLVSEFTLPLGMHMAADIIGIPEPDRAELTGLILTVLASMHPAAGDDAVDVGDRACERIEGYFRQLAAERRRRPAEDLASALLAEVREDGAEPEQGLDQLEYTAALWGLWAAGFETTVAAMGFGVLAMIDHPDAAVWLDGGPDQVRAFVAETLRHSPPMVMETVPRVAVREFRLDGVAIPAGADVRPVVGAANRDPEAFPDPDRFDPSRSTSRMVTFGSGPHRCLGTNLARMECAVALARVRRALPGLALAGRPVFRASAGLRTIERCPVAL
jgi:cytochrome P450 family 114